jgi:hypothetical protein
MVDYKVTIPQATYSPVNEVLNEQSEIRPHTPWMGFHIARQQHGADTCCPTPRIEHET